MPWSASCSSFPSARLTQGRNPRRSKLKILRGGGQGWSRYWCCKIKIGLNQLKPRAQYDDYAYTDYGDGDYGEYGEGVPPFYLSTMTKERPTGQTDIISTVKRNLGNIFSFEKGGGYDT